MVNSESEEVLSEEDKESYEDEEQIVEAEIQHVSLLKPADLLFLPVSWSGRESVGALLDTGAGLSYVAESEIEQKATH